MDFALRQPWADAQGYNLSPLRGWLFRCRNVNIHSIDKHAFVLNLRRKKTSIHVLRNFKTCWLMPAFELLGQAL